AEPRRERRCVFIDTGRGNPRAARTGVIRTPDGEVGHLAVDVAALDGAADDEVIRAPAMVGAIAIRVKRATKVRRGERRDLLRAAELDRGAIERRDVSADVGKKVRMRAELRVVQIPAADAGEENLALQAELRRG